MDSKLKGVFIYGHSASLDDALKEVGLLGFLKLRGNKSVCFGVNWQRLEGCAADVKGTGMIKLQRTAHI